MQPDQVIPSAEATPSRNSHPAIALWDDTETADILRRNSCTSRNERLCSVAIVEKRRPGAENAACATGDLRLPRLLREHEAAEFLRVSIATVRRERRLRRIGYTPVRGRVFYTEMQLRNYLNSQEVKPTCESQISKEDVSSNSGIIGSPNGQTAKGGWQRTWYDKNAGQTRRVSLGTADLEEAKLILADWVLKNETMVDEDPAVVPLATVLMRYWNEHASKLRSRQVIESNLALWNEFFGPVTVADLTKRRIREFIDDLRAKKWAPATINRCLCDGRSALNRAKRESEITSVPFIPTVEVGEPKERALSLDQMAIILDNVKSDHLVMFCLVMANTMARPEAVLELTRFQLDFESKLVRLNPEGRKQTKKYRPTVPMTNTLLPWLQKVKTNYIVTYHGGRVFSVKKAFQRLPKITKGLPERISPYCIRHTMAKELRRRGVSPWEVQGMLGHKAAGLRTTEIYAKYDPSYLSAARVAIDEVMADIDAKMTKRKIILPPQQHLVAVSAIS